MRFGILEAYNFARIKYLKLDLSQPILRQVNGLNEDTGSSNESGKTTIFNAPCWCLYGKFPSANGRIGDEIINPLVGKNCLVSQQVIHDDALVTVTRTRKHDVFKNMVLINILKNGESIEHKLDLGPKSIDAANKIIVDIIGMDYETFIRSHYFAQEGVEPFGKMTDKEMKSFFLEKLLDLSWLTDAYNESKETLGYLEAHLINEKATIERLKKNIGERYERIEDYKNKTKEWNNKREENIQTISNEIVDLEDQCKIIEDKQSAIESKMNELRVAIAVTNQSTNWREVLNKSQKKLIDANKRVAILEPRVKTLESQINEAESKYNEAGEYIGTKCSFCGGIIDESHIPHILKSALDSIKTNKKEYNKVSTLYQNESIEKDTIEGEVKELNSKAIQYDEDQKKSYELQKELNEFIKVTDVGSIKASISFKNEEIVKLRNQSDPYEEFIKKENLAIQKDVTEHNVAISQIDNLEKQIKLHSFWNKAFSSTGIQSFILDSIVKIINSFMIPYLKALTEGRISAHFTAVKQLKNGEYREKFGLSINNMDGSDSYATLSGGAKRRIDIACGMAIAKFIQQTSGKDLRLVILDEVVTGMDEYWTEEFIKLIIEEYRGYSCWFVTHQSVNPSYFDEIITVRKKDGITSIGD